MKHSKYLRYLVVPLLIVLLVAPLVLTGCSSGSADDNPTQTPFDQLKGTVSTIGGRVTQLENDLEGVDLATLGTIVGEFNDVKTQFDDLVLAFGVLQDALTGDLDALTIRVDDLEQNGDEPNGESALALTIVGSLPEIVKASEEADFSIYVENTGTSAASGQVVLQLAIQGSAADVTFSTISGSPFFISQAIYSPSQTTCTEITFISGTITLTGGQSKAYTFTLELEQTGSHWWIPTLEIAD